MEHHIREALIITGALRTAAEVDLFRLLGASPMDPAAAAAATGLSERGTRHLLAALAGLGLLRVDQAGRYAAPADVDSLLAVADGLPEVIRTGRPAGGASLPAPMQGAAVERCAEHLARPGLRILELGAGAAPWSRAIACRQPDAQVTVIDLPAAADDLVDEVWPVGNGFDLVLVPEVCHLFAPEQNAWLLTRAGQALRQGGRMAVIDVLADQLGAASGSVALYALGLLARTASGQVYSFADYVQWMRGAGLSAIERHDLGGRPPLSLIEAVY